MPNEPTVKGFLRAIIGHWITLIGGGVITGCLGLFERLSGKNIPVWAYVCILAVFVVMAAYMAWRDSVNKHIKDVAELTISHNQAIKTRDHLIGELTKESGLPQVEIKIDEALIQASGPKGAHCFLHITLSNQSEQAPCIITEWSFFLRVGDATLQGVTLIGIRDRELAHYVETYDFSEIPLNTPYYINDGGLPMVEAAIEDITDIRDLITEDHPLRRGFPRSGWIGFFVAVGAVWPSYKSRSPIDDEQEVIIYKTNVVQEVTLSITDGHGKSHSGSKLPPFTVTWEDRQIIKRQSPLPLPDSSLL